ncbi:MAG: hypothetical protein PHI85_07235 [Victivallaceae bacterium]|nr:hypothetical protein [Victivallaceae bacterium]
MKKLLIAAGAFGQFAMFAQEAGGAKIIGSAPWYSVLWQLLILEWQKCCLAAALVALVIVFFSLNAKKKAKAAAAEKAAETPDDNGGDKQA